MEPRGGFAPSRGFTAEAPQTPLRRWPHALLARRVTLRTTQLPTCAAAAAQATTTAANRPRPPMLPQPPAAAARYISVIAATAVALVNNAATSAAGADCRDKSSTGGTNAHRAIDW